MKPTLALLSCLAVVALAGCGGADSSEANATGDASPSLDAEGQEWCESFKRIENSSHSVESGQVFADANDATLSQAQRQTAAARYQELLALPVNASTDAECVGPVWDRFYEETEVRASSMAAAATTTAASATSGVTWTYLQSEYAQLLTGSDCGGDATAVNICLGIRSGQLDSFERDATDLPVSKSRSDLLETVENYREYDKDFDDGYCGMDPSQLNCTTATTQMDMSHGLIATIVNREATK